MKEKLGYVAGDICHILKERDEVPTSELSRILNERLMIINLALGWLAREDRIDFRAEGDKTFVSLSEKKG